MHTMYFGAQTFVKAVKFLLHNMQTKKMQNSMLSHLKEKKYYNEASFQVGWKASQWQVAH